MSAIENITKRCGGCRQDKPVGSFLYSQFTSDGMTDRCLICISKAAAANREQRELRRAPTVKATGKKPRNKQHRRPPDHRPRQAEQHA